MHLGTFTSESTALASRSKKRAFDDSVVPRFWKHDCLVTLLALCFLFATSATVCSTPLDDIGYNALVAELGAAGVAVPDGSGVTASQIEAPWSDGTYQPNLSSSTFAGKTINVVGTTSGTSPHANVVAGRFYGNSSIASGITDIDVYQAVDFVQSESLNLTDGSEPSAETQDVQNHSWIATFGSANTDRQVIRRMDYVVNRDDVTVVAALNNGSGSSVPSIFGSSHNVIVTGVTDGDHSTGQATLDSPTLQVPHIVAPDNFTSFANPYVAGAAALLLDHARSDVSRNLADRNEVVRSLLLAGATKDEFAAWSNTSAAPLDEQFGTGELHVQRSYHILDAGNQAPSTNSVGGAMGWDLQTFATGTNTYFFDIASGDTLNEFSAVLTWNRRIIDTDPSAIGFNPTPTAANDLDLRLYSVDPAGFTLDTMLAESVSGGNVEHIYFNDALGINTGLGTGSSLGEGRYAIVVDAGSATQDYALSWLHELVPPPLSCDFDSDGDCDSVDIDLMYSNFGPSQVAVFDIDGSGSVDSGDIIPWLNAASDPANPFNTNGLTFMLGDVDFDGKIDSTDLGLLLNNFAGTNSDYFYGDGDLDGNDEIDSTDLGLLLNNFGFDSTVAALAVSAVPEPANLAWLAAILSAFLLRKRLRQ